ncbi:MAG: LysR family transcriptional regulator [Dehalococcoidia bacterium]|nr:LysR family transcriptional regulator [Dehalococcoidia bacterium]
MELGQVQAFIQVARLQSFRRAAEALFLTQPTVTARIQALERDLSESLFERSTRSVRLTEAGKLFLAYAERAMHALEEGQTGLEEFRKTKAGLLRIGTARTIGTYTLPKLLHVFRQRFPEIEIVVRTGRSAGVVDMLLNDEVQIGLGRFMQHHELTPIQLFDEHIVLVTHPEHRFAKAGKASIMEIAKEPLVLYDAGSFYYTAINNACQQAGIVPKVTMQMDSIEATKKIVELGLGISLLPRSSFEREQQDGTLVQVDIQDKFQVVLSTTLFHRKGARLAGPPSAFIEVAQDLFSSKPSSRATSTQSAGVKVS